MTRSLHYGIHKYLFPKWNGTYSPFPLEMVKVYYCGLGMRRFHIQHMMKNEVKKKKIGFSAARTEVSGIKAVKRLDKNGLNARSVGTFYACCTCSDVFSPK